MRKSQLLLPFIACALTIPIPAFAAKSPLCKPVLDAMERVYTVDHSATSQMDGRKNETIVANGKSYIKLQDKWTIGPFSLQEMIQQQRKNVRNVKVYTCKQLADSVVDSQPVSVFSAHSESENGTTSDVKLWLSKATGLPVQSEGDISIGGSKRHLLIRYAYTNIRAPLTK
jgi:hypothetical protein